MNNHHTVMTNRFNCNTRLPIFALAVLAANAVFGAYDPDFSKQWHLSNTGQVIQGSAGVRGIDIDWIEAMKIYKPKGKTVVAVVDTGVSVFHNEFYDKVNNEWLSPYWFNINEYVSDQLLNGIDDDNNGHIDDIVGWSYGPDNSVNAVYDYDGHGTAVASTINVNKNNKGLEPLAPDVQIMAVKIQEESGPLNSDRISASINYARLNGAKIINLSLGGSQYRQENLNLMKQLADQDILVVAASGNGGSDQIGDNNDITPHYPSSYDSSNIISVASINNKGNLSSFSNYGLQSVDIAAPGENIFSAVSEQSVSDEKIYGWGSYYNNTNNLDWFVGFMNDDDSNANWSIGYYNNIYVLGDSLNLGYLYPNTYYDNTHSYAYSKEIDLSGYTDCSLLFSYWIDLTSGDYAYLEIYDGYQYHILKTFYPNESRQNFETIDISSYDGKKIRIRFRLKSDSGWGSAFNGDGLDVRDIGVYGYPVLNDPLAFASGTSFAAPVVSGVAALVWSHRPNLTAQEVRSIILESAYKLPSLTGKVATGGMVDARAALALADVYHANNMKAFFNPVSGFSDDWIYSDSWNSAYTGYFPWLFHTYHGWLFASGSGNSVIWLYDFEMGWLYTNGLIYPYMFSAIESKWLYYDNGTTSPRQFYTFDGTAAILVEQSFP